MSPSYESRVVTVPIKDGGDAARPDEHLLREVETRLRDQAEMRLLAAIMFPEVGVLLEALGWKHDFERREWRAPSGKVYGEWDVALVPFEPVIAYGLYLADRMQPATGVSGAIEARIRRARIVGA